MRVAFVCVNNYGELSTTKRSVNGGYGARAAWAVRRERGGHPRRLCRWGGTDRRRDQAGTRQGTGDGSARRGREKKRTAFSSEGEKTKTRLKIEREGAALSLNWGAAGFFPPHIPQGAPEPGMARGAGEGSVGTDAGATARQPHTKTGGTETSGAARRQPEAQPREERSHTNDDQGLREQVRASAASEAATGHPPTTKARPSSAETEHQTRSLPPT